MVCAFLGLVQTQLMTFETFEPLIDYVNPEFIHFAKCFNIGSLSGTSSHLYFGSRLLEAQILHRISTWRRVHACCLSTQLTLVIYRTWWRQRWVWTAAYIVSMNINVFYAPFYTQSNFYISSSWRSCFNTAKLCHLEFFDRKFLTHLSKNQKHLSPMIVQPSKSKQFLKMFIWTTDPPAFLMVICEVYMSLSNVYVTCINDSRSFLLSIEGKLLSIVYRWLHHILKVWPVSVILYDTRMSLVASIMCLTLAPRPVWLKNSTPATSISGRINKLRVLWTRWQFLYHLFCKMLCRLETEVHVIFFKNNLTGNLLSMEHNFRINFCRIEICS